MIICYNLCYKRRRRDEKLFFYRTQRSGGRCFAALTAQVNRHIEEYGVTEFFVGNYGGFDRMAAKAVITAKKAHPKVTLTMLLPYHPAERPVRLPKGFDDSFYPPDMEKVPRRLAIVRANQYMVDHTDFLIAYVRHPGSNTANLVEYAKKREEKQLIAIGII